MKLKKYIGSLLLMLVAVVINTGTASVAMVGVEEMPDSLKELR